MMDQTDEDIILHCVECKRDFVFAAGEAKYYRSRLLSLPKRCPSCRAERRARLVPDEGARHED